MRKKENREGRNPYKEWERERAERERGIDRPTSIRVARDKGKVAGSFSLKALGWPKTTSNTIISLAFGQNL